MNIYKAPNLIISPKRKVYRMGGGGALSNESVYTHTYTHTLSLSLLPPPSLSLSLPPSLPSFSVLSLPLYTHTSITVSGREGYWDGKRCVFRADLKANVELE